MDQYEIRELCEAFFDAYENRRVDVIEKLYSDDCIVWHNVFGRETTRDENLARYHEGYAGQRRRTYNDRIVKQILGFQRRHKFSKSGVRRRHCTIVRGIVRLRIRKLNPQEEWLSIFL